MTGFLLYDTLNFNVRITIYFKYVVQRPEQQHRSGLNPSQKAFPARRADDGLSVLGASSPVPDRLPAKSIPQRLGRGSSNQDEQWRPLHAEACGGRGVGSISKENPDAQIRNRASVPGPDVSTHRR